MRSAPVTLLLTLGLAGCAGDRSPPPRRGGLCYATTASVREYIQRVADLVNNRARTDVMWARETATVAFDLGDDGSASHFQVVRAPRPEAGEVVLQAAMAAAPFPPPGFDVEACHGRRVEISITSSGRCDAARADQYTDALIREIQAAVNTAGITAPAERAQVTLRIKLSAAGAAQIAVHDAPSEESGAQVAAIAQKLSPFETPDDTIRECVTERSFFAWVGLPGITRGPVRIPD